jgi:hypothetical protein
MKTAGANGELDDPSGWLLSEGDDWEKLSEWALYYIRFGIALSRASNIARGRMLVCISVPLRPYVTSFIVAGYYVGKIKGGTMAENVTWFDELRARSAPVLATYLSRRNSRFVVYKGYLDPPHSEKYLRLKYGPNLWELIDVNNVRYVSIHPGPVEPIGKTRTPTAVPDESLFWQDAGFEPKAAIATLGDNRLDVVVVGIKRELTEEFSNLSVRVSQHTQNSLTLAQLSGVRVSDAAHQAKTEIISVRTETAIRSVPRFSIFDGRAAFLQCADQFRDCHHVIITDRLAVQHHAATVDRVNSLYVDWRSEEDIRALFPQPPRGIDYAAFTLRKTK